MGKEKPMSNEIEIASHDHKHEIERFEETLVSFLNSQGLPSDGLFATVPNRAVVINNFPNVITRIRPEEIEKSVYISKFLASVASGLFDAALNYLWDETISQLRRRVACYDISYFFDNAGVSDEKRKRLKDEGDLDKIDDSELIHGAFSIELISFIGFKHLDFIRSMRNWASAAHPNNNEITGLQLISWLETCIIEVINLPESQITVNIKQLLGNIRVNTITATEAAEIGEFFNQLTREQIDNLAQGFFGIYTRLESSAQTRTNVRLLTPLLWPRVDESVRQSFGIRYGKFAANNDNAQSKLAREFLETVSGLSYLPTNTRTAELRVAIDNLIEGHRAAGNFYSEPALARELKRLVGEAGQVPEGINQKYVLALVEVFMTNGNGVAWNAQPHYRWMLERLSPEQALIAATAFMDSTIASRLQFTTPKNKFLEVLEMMSARVSSEAGKELIESIKSYQGPFEKLREDARIKQKMQSFSVISKAAR
jgi:hypothetical protein